VNRSNLAHPFRVGEVVFQPLDDPQTRSEKYARVVLDAMYQFVGLLDSEGMTLDINAAALKGAGLTMDAIAGLPFWQARWFQVSEQTQSLIKKFVERAKGGEFIRCDLEVYGQAAGEQTIVVDFSLLPVKDAQGRVVFLLAEGRNITEKKRIEALLSHAPAQTALAQDSARLVAEQASPEARSASSIYRQLAQSDRVNTMGKLMASIAHEVNQPLAAIVTNSEACTRWLNALPPNEEEARQALQRIVRDAQRASDVIAHIRGYLSKGEQRAQLLHIHDVIADVLKLVGLEAHERMVKLVFEPGQGVRYSRMNRGQVQQVLVNLVINGMEAMLRVDPPKRVVTIRTRALGEASIKVEVMDAGHGIDPSIQANLFEAFRSTKRNGMGMGLSICRSIVESHGGEIGCIPNAGAGVTFGFTLPCDVVQGVAT
jgi:PAS domain S-box-containing protein